MSRSEVEVLRGRVVDRRGIDAHGEYSGAMCKMGRDDGTWPTRTSVSSARLIDRGVSRVDISILPDWAKVDPLCEANNSPGESTSSSSLPSGVKVAWGRSTSLLIRLKRSLSCCHPTTGDVGSDIGAEMFLVDIRGGVWAKVADIGPLDHFRGKRNLGGDGKMERERRFLVPGSLSSVGDGCRPGRDLCVRDNVKWYVWEEGILRGTYTFRLIPFSAMLRGLLSMKMQSLRKVTDGFRAGMGRAC